MEHREIIEGLQNEGVYEFIINNYWKMSKDQLKDILKELDYAVNSNVKAGIYDLIKDNLIEELTEMWDD